MQHGKYYQAVLKFVSKVESAEAEVPPIVAGGITDYWSGWCVPLRCTETTTARAE
jgi:hypothetical protein